MSYLVPKKKNFKKKTVCSNKVYDMFTRLKKKTKKTWKQKTKHKVAGQGQDKGTHSLCLSAL